MSLHITLTQLTVCWEMNAGDTKGGQTLSTARAHFQFREVTKTTITAIVMLIANTYLTVMYQALF